jgi:hypothetical protein
MFLALLGWLSPRIVAAMLLGIVVLGFPKVVRWAVAAAAAIKPATVAFWEESFGFKIIGILTLILVLLQGFNSLLPPTSGSDAEAFYLALPKLISASHRLLPMPGGFEFFSQIGLQGELHFSALMSVSNPQAAKLFVWPTSLAIGLMVMGLGKSVGLGRQGSYISLAILFTSTVFTNIIWDGKVDLFATAMGLSAYYWALQVSRVNGALALAGLFTGLALVAKFSFIPTLLPGVILIVLLQRGVNLRSVRSGRSWGSEVRTWSLFAAWMVLTFVPHFLKNAILFGQPFAPFVGPTAKALLDQTWFSPEVTQRIVLTYPLALVLGDYPMQHGNLSSLLLAFIPLALFIKRPRALFDSRLFQLSLAGVLGVVLWLLLRPSVLAPRYMLAPLIAFIPLAGRGAEYALSATWGGRLFRLIVLSCCIGILAHEVAAAQTNARKALDMVTGKYTMCELSGGFCTASEVVNREAMLGDRVFMGAYSSYWLRSDLIQNISTLQEQISVGSQKTPEAAWDMLRRLGFRYALVFRVTHSTLFQLLDLSRVPHGMSAAKLMDLEGFVIYRLENEKS